MKPNKVNKANSKYVHRNLVKSTNKKHSKSNKYKVGDTVRISKYKHIFAKSYTPNWTTELFTIVDVKNTKPVTYILKDEQGNVIKDGFYQEELSKTKYKDFYLVEKVIKKKGDKLGFPRTQNSWIDKKDII